MNKCVNCGEPFKPRQGKQLYCTPCSNVMINKKIARLHDKNLRKKPKEKKLRTIKLNNGMEVLNNIIGQTMKGSGR